MDLDLAALAFEGSVILRGTEALRVHGDAQFGNGIIGNAGDNVFIECGGRDTLIGGDGDDVFAFVRDARSWALIEDFEAGDRIALDDSFFGLGDRGVDVRDVTPDQVSAAIRSGKALYDRQTGDLSYDHDGRAGPGDSALIATIMGAPTLAADDLLLF